MILYGDNTFKKENFTNFIESHDRFIGIFGYCNQKLEDIDTENLQNLDGDYVILVKQKDQLVLIIHPLLSKNCYYDPHNLKISLLAEDTFIRCEPNTVYKFVNNKLSSKKQNYEWRLDDTVKSFEQVFESFEQIMIHFPSAQTTMSSGKDTGVIGCYFYQKNIDSDYHFYINPGENPQIIEKRIKAMTDKSKFFNNIVSSSDWYKKIDLAISKCQKGAVLFGIGGDQLYRHKSNITHPLNDINLAIEKLCLDRSIVKCNPLMSKDLYQSWLLVDQKYRQNQCWQSQYMEDFGYAYQVDKYYK